MWGDAFAGFSALNRERELDGEDLERLAVAAYMLGSDEACEQGWLAAHRAWLRRGEVERAAGCAFWQALGLFFRGDLAPAMGWVARGGRLLEESRRDSVEQAWLGMLTALPRLFQGDAAVYPVLIEAGETAQRLADPDAAMFARMCRGDALILEGRVAEGMGLLDEVMVSVTADEVAPMLAGIAYCQVIALCQAVFDLRRAREWTEALTRWCDSQPDVVPFRGNCLVHRCEILQLQGAWTEAHASARQACEWLAGPPTWDALGSAHYQLAEIQRCAASWHRRKSPTVEPALRDGTRARDVVVARGAGTSRSRASGYPSRARRGGSSDHACAPTSSLCRDHARDRRSGQCAGRGRRARRHRLAARRPLPERALS